MKKLFTLLMLALMSIGSAWAETESSGNTGTNNTSWVGKSMTLDGKYIAGSGGVKQGNMPDKGVKLRSNQGNLVFAVNAGYKVTSFKFWSAGNTTTAVDIESVTVDGGDNQITSTLTIPGKGESTSADISLTDIAAKDNVTITFASGSSAQIVGTWQIEYIQEEVIIQEISAVTLNGSPISADDLSTLKSTKALAIDGSSLNGIGALDVTLSSGSTTVTKVIKGTTATYSFTINSSESYTVTVTGIGGTYTEQGAVVYYKKGETDVDGANTKSVTANGITFTMVDAAKNFQYGTGSVTLGETKYVPLKLSTGSAVNVTFPDGKVATKVIVYGWSLSGNGKLYSMSESNGSAKSVDVSSDVFYATNTAGDIYPSVYEYELDNWESLFFNPGGSPSQPFVVMDFILEDAPTTVPVTISSAGYATFSNASEVTVPEGVTAYTAVKKDESTISLLPIDGGVIPAGEGVVLKADAGNYDLNITTTGAVKIEGNLLKAQLTDGTPEDAIYYTLAAGPTFKKSSGGTLAAGKAYLVLPAAESRGSFNVTFGDATGISEVNAAQEDGALYNLNGIRVAKATKGLYIQNGKKVIVK